MSEKKEIKPMKAAIMGSADMIRVYGSFGIDRYVTDADNAINILTELKHENYAIVLVTSALAAEVPELLERYKYDPLPSVIEIPAGIEKLEESAGMSILRDSARRATGIDILGRL